MSAERPAGLIARALARLAGAAASASATRAGPPLPATPAELTAEMQSIKTRLGAGEAAAVVDRLEALAGSPLASADVPAHAGIARVLMGQHAQAIPWLERAVSADPRHGIALKFITVALAETGRPAEALARGEQALKINPSDSETLGTVGVTLMRLGRRAQAARHFERALQARSDDLTALTNLVMLHGGGLERFSELPPLSPRTAQILARARKRMIAELDAGTLAPANAPVLIALLHGSREHFPVLERLVVTHPASSETAPDAESLRRYLLVHARAGRAAEAADLATRMAERSGNRGAPMHTAGSMQVAAGTGAWLENWRRMRDAHPDIEPDHVVRQVPQWDGSATGDRSVFVYQDQGYGDAIIALRLVGALARRGVRFVPWVKPTLAGLARSAPGCEALVSSESLPDPRDHGCALAIPMFGLVSALALGPADIAQAPVLRADPAATAAWRERLATLSGRRVGVALLGNPERHDDWVRSVMPAAAQPLTALRDRISWVNLSVDRRPERDTLIRQLGATDPTSALRTLDDTAALIASLDAVVTIDSVVAHLAAALGKPTWVLVPTQVDWRWRIGDRLSPWWPAVHALPASRPGDWAEPIDRLGAALAAA